MSDEQKTRQYADKIDSETLNKWALIKFKNRRKTAIKDIMTATKLSKPVIIRALLDNMATPNTIQLIDNFFNTFK